MYERVNFGNSNQTNKHLKLDFGENVKEEKLAQFTSLILKIVKCNGSLKRSLTFDAKTRKIRD